MHKADKPLISIVVCVYNGDKFLSGQLDSIITQDYFNLEIIIVDDCSIDNSWAILKGYQAADHRIKLYRNENNIGYVKNFEKAIQLCTGNYFALADQDDIWVSDKISVMFGEIKDDILAYHDSDYIDENGRRLGDKTVSSVFRVYDGSSCIPFILFNCVHGHATLFNSTIKKYIFPFDQRFTHDWWLTYVAFNVGTVKYINKVLVHYRQHQSTITDSLLLKKYTENLQTKPVRGIDRISLNLELLEYCATFQYNRNRTLINKIWNSFSGLAKGRERLSTFWILIKYYDVFFYIHYQRKSVLSKLNTIRKICFS